MCLCKRKGLDSSNFFFLFYTNTPVGVGMEQHTDVKLSFTFIILEDIFSVIFWITIFLESQIVFIPLCKQSRLLKRVTKNYFIFSSQLFCITFLRRVEIYFFLGRILCRIKKIKIEEKKWINWKNPRKIPRVRVTVKILRKSYSSA